MAYCTKCGKEVQEGDSFCHACGTPVGKSGQAAPAAPLMPPGSSPPSTTAAPMPPVTAPTAPSGKTQEQLLEEKVERRLKDRTALMYHIAAYVIVNIFLVFVWALSGAGYPWFLWCLAPWGVGLAFHVFAYFIGDRNDSAKQRMIQKEMEKLQQEQAPSGEAKAPEEAQT